MSMLPLLFVFLIILFVGIYLTSTQEDNKGTGKGLLFGSAASVVLAAILLIYIANTIRC